MVMLSYKRPYMLIPALEEILKKNIKMNICLRVQGAEEITIEERRRILELCEAFVGFDLQFTRGNHYTGIPRHDIINRALTHFNTPFILTADDDMKYANNAIASCVAALMQNPEYGVISHWCNPSYGCHAVIDGVFQKLPLQSPFTVVETLGSGTAVYRREVYDKCEYDKNYTLGCADYDFGMQMKQVGWKAGVICIEELKSLNDNKKGEPRNKEYWKHRYNKVIISKSIELFKD